MTENHPITPTRELVREWAKGCSPYDIPADHIAQCAARWGADQQLKLDIEQVNRAWQKGADQELEACVEWVSQWCGRRPDGTRPEEELRAARRPKLLSLKEEALLLCDDYIDPEGIIRRALEQLDD